MNAIEQAQSDWWYESYMKAYAIACMKAFYHAYIMEYVTALRGLAESGQGVGGQPPRDSESATDKLKTYVRDADSFPMAC